MARPMAARARVMVSHGRMNAFWRNKIYYIRVRIATTLVGSFPQIHPQVSACRSACCATQQRCLGVYLHWEARQTWVLQSGLNSTYTGVMILEALVGSSKTGSGRPLYHYSLLRSERRRWLSSGGTDFQDKSTKTFYDFDKKHPMVSKADCIRNPIEGPAPGISLPQQNAPSVCPQCQICPDRAPSASVLLVPLVHGPRCCRSTSVCFLATAVGMLAARRDSMREQLPSIEPCRASGPKQ